MSISKGNESHGSGATNLHVTNEVRATIAMIANIHSNAVYRDTYSSYISIYEFHQNLDQRSRFKSEGRSIIKETYSTFVTSLSDPLSDC